MAVLALATASHLSSIESAAAETRTDNLDFTIYFGGVRIGTVQMSAEISDAEFVIEGSITSSGLGIGLVRVRACQPGSGNHSKRRIPSAFLCIHDENEETEVRSRYRLFRRPP